jgi:integrase
MLQDNMQHIINKYITEAIDAYEEQQATRVFNHWEERIEEEELVNELVSRAKEDLYINNQRLAEVFLQDILSTNEDLEVPTDKTQKALLKRSLLKAHVDVREDIKKRMQGDYSSKLYENAMTSSNTPTPVTVHAQKEPKSPLASELIDDFLSDRDKQKGNNPKTAEANRNKVKLFIEIAGDKPVTEYARKDIKDYRDILELIPSNMRKKKAYRDLSIKQMIDKGVPEKDRLSIQTVNDNIMRTTAFFKWLQTEQYRSDSIAEDIKIVNKANPKEARSPFSSEDLSKVFNSNAFTNDLNITLDKRPERVFIPLLGLYLGMRLNEACQLFEDDIIVKDGITCIQIPLEDNEKGQRVKTKAGARVIPIHPTLIKAGFLDYVQLRRREAPKQLLWKTLTLTRDGYAKNMSSWFNKTLLPQVGLKGLEGRKLDFHSFRHTVLDLYNNSSKEQRHYQAIVGHSDKSVTVDTYGSSMKVTVMLDTMQVVEYADVHEVSTLIERLESYFTS